MLKSSSRSSVPESLENSEGPRNRTMDKYSLEAREGQLRFWYSCTEKNPHDGRGACLKGQAPPESPWEGAVDSPDTLYLPQVCSWEHTPPSQHDGLTSHHPSSLSRNIAVKRYRQHVLFLVPPHWNSSTHLKLSSQTGTLVFPPRDLGTPSCALPHAQEGKRFCYSQANCTLGVQQAEGGHTTTALLAPRFSSDRSDRSSGYRCKGDKAWLYSRCLLNLFHTLDHGEQPGTNGTRRIA